MREQVGLYGTLTGAAPAQQPPAEAAPQTADSQDGAAPLADVVALPRRDREGPARQRRDR